MFPAGRNPFGLDDMAGNVWEWTLSQYKPYPYDSGDGREGLTGPGFRVVRGGSWLYGAGWARCAYRLRLIPANFLDFLGFRCGVFPGLGPDS
jgi:formylglycine-generating enzyme required for sulfatase activity